MWWIDEWTVVGFGRLPVVHFHNRNTDRLTCFKFAGLAFFPFGKEVVYGGGAVSLIANIIWLIVSGIPMAVGNAVTGMICCMTIIGIPFGKQFFKIAKLSLMPFGAEVI